MTSGWSWARVDLEPHINSMAYVDGFLLPVPKKHLALYRKIALKAGKVWREHGALEYRDSDGDRYTLAVLHEYVANLGDAWVYTLDELGRYLERIGSEFSGAPPAGVLPTGSLLELAEQVPLPKARRRGRRRHRDRCRAAKVPRRAGAALPPPQRSAGTSQSQRKSAAPPEKTSSSNSRITMTKNMKTNCCS